MHRCVLLVLALVAMALSKATIDDTMRIFRNTVKKWNVQVRNKRDFKERYNRLKAMKRSVDATTSGVVLDTLNRFAVNNDEEHAELMSRVRRGANLTLAAMNAMRDSEDDIYTLDKRNSILRRRQKREADPVYEEPDWNNPPEEYDFYENHLGMSEPQDQGSCGSCWSFPASAAMEAVYKRITGEHVVYSKQYFVDCTYPYNGCAGGTTNAAYRVTKDRQYLMSEADHPFTADYQSCRFTEDIESKRNNAMRKAWFGDWFPITSEEPSFIKALEHSPVAFGSFISDNYFGYFQGVYDDDLCATEPKPHAQLLVGYTATTLRVRGSFGLWWGDRGYINYLRGSQNLLNCNFFNDGYGIVMFERKDVEYQYCNSAKPTTRPICEQSCRDMDRPGSTGWTLATIPTVQHNNQLVNMVNSKWPGVKADDKFNLLWIGLTDITKTENYKWSDPAFSVNYFNYSSRDTGQNKYGLLNKNTGAWETKNNLNFLARGLCSRARTCFDMSSKVANGAVEFSTEDVDNLVEETTATVVCNAGCVTEGPDSLTCRAGFWRGADGNPAQFSSCTCPEVEEEEVEEEVVEEEELEEEEEVVEEEEVEEKKKKKKEKKKKKKKKGRGL